MGNKDIREELKTLNFSELRTRSHGYYRDEDWNEWDQANDELQQRRNAAHPRPSCCQEARDYPTVMFRAYFNDSADGRWMAAMPHDYMRLAGKKTKALDYYDKTPVAKFCAYCGNGLPRMVPKAEFPADTGRVVGGSYSCKTCGETSHCSCLPPEFAWEPAQ